MVTIMVTNDVVSFLSTIMVTMHAPYAQVEPYIAKTRSEEVSLGVAQGAGGMHVAFGGYKTTILAAWATWENCLAVSGDGLDLVFDFFLVGC